MKKFNRNKPKIKYPLATVTPYGPDDKTVIKLAVGIIPNEESSDTGAMNRWVGTDIVDNPKVAKEMYEFMRSHNVKTVTTATVVMGCPHEEGQDFPKGEDCPFCPFWKGKQGSGGNDSLRWQRLQSIRVERLEPSYRFWL